MELLRVVFQILRVRTIKVGSNSSNLQQPVNVEQSKPNMNEHDNYYTVS